jgi:FHA domain
MSFKLFIYYCALCGAWAAFIGWAFGRFMVAQWPGRPDAWTRTLLEGATLGTAVAIAVGFVDALWNRVGHQAAPIVGRSLLVGALGCVFGLFGAAVGLFLFRVTEVEPVLILGWTLTGLFIGASVGTLELAVQWFKGKSIAGQVRKIVNGLLGGAIGGLLGGLLWAAIGRFFGRIFDKPAHELWSGSAWGFVALGTCIGLFIGLAQVILKEGWLRVETGFKAGRALLLTKDEVLIGRAEACDLGLFGDSDVERRHARILRQKSRYVLVDEGTSAGTFLNDQRVVAPTSLKSGDAIRVGSNLLRFGERQSKRS